MKQHAPRMLATALLWGLCFVTVPGCVDDVPSFQGSSPPPEPPFPLCDTCGCDRYIWEAAPWVEVDFGIPSMPERRIDCPVDSLPSGVFVTLDSVSATESAGGIGSVVSVQLSCSSLSGFGTEGGAGYGWSTSVSEWSMGTETSSLAEISCPTNFFIAGVVGHRGAAGGGRGFDRMQLVCTRLTMIDDGLLGWGANPEVTAPTAAGEALGETFESAICPTDYMAIAFRISGTTHADELRVECAPIGTDPYECLDR